MVKTDRELKSVPLTKPWIGPFSCGIKKPKVLAAIKNFNSLQEIVPSDTKYGFWKKFFTYGLEFNKPNALGKGFRNVINHNESDLFAHARPQALIPNSCVHLLRSSEQQLLKNSWFMGALRTLVGITNAFFFRNIMKIMIFHYSNALMYLEWEVQHTFILLGSSTKAIMFQSHFVVFKRLGTLHQGLPSFQKHYV
ncbi:hypothetical protein BC830DRAFT_1215669 [Chytriomyces sp. MP71]|nr:hypothetical protein BC830DRAFT_1215669 [Chytriomyces sp. MP71]